MLYGNSSLGKTELVREVAKRFYNDDYYEKHLSMFKNDTYSDYFLGERPNRKTLGYDLLERKSNLVFLDEIDKFIYFSDFAKDRFFNRKFRSEEMQKETHAYRTHVR